MCWLQFFDNMKLILTLTILSLLLSCGTKTSRSEQSTKPEDKWEKTSHTFTTNTYTSTGLLDICYKTTLLYQMGMLLDTIKSIVVHKYDNSRLTNKKEFALEKDGSKILWNEITKQYDAKGNLTTEIQIVNSNILTKTINEHNGKGLLIKSTNIFQTMSDNPNDYILDSVVVHRNDKKQFKYDTTLNTYEYDLNGNPTHVISSDTKGVVHVTTITQYSGNEKTFSFSLTPQGDTTGTLTFQHDGKLIKHIVDMKKMNTVDTIWFDNDKIIKSISHHGQMKYKNLTTYNDKGDEIESASYK